MNREYLISCGEHIHAMKSLPAEYSPEEYILAVSDARMVDAGERYADRVLGPEVVTAVGDGEDEDGARVYASAMNDLKERGILDPSQAELLDALMRVTS